MSTQPGLAGRLGDQVEALVHPIDEIYVGVAGRAEDHAGTVCNAAGGMSGQVIAAEIGFGFDDDSSGGTVHEDRAEEAAGDLDCGSGVEGAGNHAAGLHCTMLIAKCDCLLAWTCPRGWWRV